MPGLNVSLLIVDDEALVRMCLVRILIESGYAAVSYTHLDVYKRQEWQRIYFARNGRAPCRNLRHLIPGSLAGHAGSI